MVDLPREEVPLKLKVTKVAWFTLISHPGSAVDFQASSCSSALHPFGSTEFLLPSGSAFVPPTSPRSARPLFLSDRPLFRLGPSSFRHCLRLCWVFYIMHLKNNEFRSELKLQSALDVVTELVICYIFEGSNITMKKKLSLWIINAVSNKISSASFCFFFLHFNDR